MSTLIDVTTLLLQLAIFGTLLESIRRRNVPATVNAAFVLAAALTPVVVQQAVSARVSIGPELLLWIALAGFLHSIGMLGLYDSRWWWDHVTHTVSAGLIAALLYASLLAAGRTTSLPASTTVAAVLTILLVFLFGVVWELIELVARDVGERYGVDPILVHYGWRDTAFDLVFDLVGALIVVLLDLRSFVPIMEQFPRTTIRALTATVGLAITGAVLLALFVQFDT